MQTENVSGDQVAVDAPQDDYVVHSETVKAEPEPEVKPDIVEEPKPEAQADDEAEEQDTAEAKPKRGGFQKKIGKLEVENAELRAELERERSGKQPKSAESVPDATGKPDQNDFDTWEQYTEALTDWKIDQREKERDAKSREDSQRQKNTEAFSGKVNSHKERANEFAKEATDYDAKIGEYTQSGHLTPIVEAAILDSDVSERVAYYLASHPEEAMKLSDMGIVAVNKYIGKIEARLENQSPKVAAVRTTKAPPPVKPVGSIKSNGPVDLDKADMETYTRKREADIRSVRGY